MNLEAAIRALEPHLGDALVVHANGHISRRSFDVRDRQGNFYMIGSMGLASSIALGVATARPDRRVIVFDGDGNLLMNLGALAMTASLRPRNLLHVVFDNGAYGSTGNQPTISRDLALEELAGAAGYVRAARVATMDDLDRLAGELLAAEGPSFLLAEIETDAGPFTAKRVSHSPEAIRDRFAAAIADPARAGAP